MYQLGGEHNMYHILMILSIFTIKSRPVVVTTYMTLDSAQLCIGAYSFTKLAKHGNV